LRNQLRKEFRPDPPGVLGLYHILNRPYSKVNKSTTAKMALIFAHFWFGVITFCIVVTIKNELVFETNLFIFIVAITQKEITLNWNEPK
jgi:hypothetical protein